MGNNTLMFDPMHHLRSITEIQKVFSLENSATNQMIYMV